MKKFLQYTAWTWSMSRTPCGMVLATGAAAECVLLIATAGMMHSAWCSYQELVMSSGLLWVAAIVYLALPVCSQLPQYLAGGRAHGEFTALTMPFPRWQILSVRALAAALWMVVGTAVQVALLAILWGPVTALQDSVAAGCFQFELTARGRIWWDLADCGLFRLLLPSEPMGVLVWSALILAPSLMWASVTAHVGPRRVIAGLLALANQAVFAFLGFGIVSGNTNFVQLASALLNQPTQAVLLLMAAVVLLLTLWGLYAMQRSESAV